MEHKRHVKIILILALALSPALVFGYDNTKTHPMLTSEAIKLSEASGQSNFNESEKERIIQGSIDEDNVPRWLEHFYDPINNRGLNSGQFNTSKAWAHGRALVPNDYTWDNSIYDYAYGDKNQGLYALGHVIHLVQDATVPDHTRDDPHPIVKTYETYSYDQNSVAKSSPIYLNTIDAYFDSAANFANGNFFSDDTILKYYANPKIMNEKWERDSTGVDVDFGIGNYGRIVLIKRLRDNFGVLRTEYSLKDTDNKVMSDYWNTLAPKAVGYSAGIIKLFLAEVEKEKMSGALKEARTPWWEKLLNLAKVRVDQVLASVNLSISEGAKSGPAGTIPPPSTNGETATGDSGETSSAQTDQDKLIETRDKLQKLRSDLDNLTGQGETAILPVIHSVNSALALAGAPTLDTDKPTTTEPKPEAVIILPPIITSPADFAQTFATSSITFSGTASSGLAILNSFNNERATTSEAGEWTMVLNDLPQGTSTIKFWASDSDGNISSTTDVAINIDSIPLEINLTISNCASSLANNFCLLKPTSTLNFSWSATKPGDYKYDLIKSEYDWGEDWYEPEIALASVTETSGLANLNFGSKDLFREFKWQVVARDANSGEVVASSSEVHTVFHPRPVVINEIGWAGTVNSNLDEWLELRNYLTKQAVDLTGYYLADSAKTWTINLSGEIPVKGYYLIERGNDDVISNRSAQLIDNFVSDPSLKALGPANLSLKLWRKTSVGDELVDETPLWDKTGAEPGSLERTFENAISTNLSAWSDNSGCRASDGSCALDRNATTTFGTPGVINFASIPRRW